MTGDEYPSRVAFRLPAGLGAAGLASLISSLDPHWGEPSVVNPTTQARRLCVASVGPKNRRIRAWEGPSCLATGARRFGRPIA